MPLLAALSMLPATEGFRDDRLKPALGKPGIHLLDFAIILSMVWPFVVGVDTGAAVRRHPRGSDRRGVGAGGAVF